MSDSLNGDSTQMTKTSCKDELDKDSAKLYYCWSVTENHLSELSTSLPDNTWVQLARDYLRLPQAEVQKAKGVATDTGAEDAKMAVLHAWQSHETHPSIGNLLERLCDAADHGLLDMKTFHFLLHPNHITKLEECADDEEPNSTQKGVFAERLMFAIFLSVWPAGIRDLVRGWDSMSCGRRLYTALAPAGILVYTLFLSSASRIRLPLLAPSRTDVMSQRVRPSHYTGMKHFSPDDTV